MARKPEATFRDSVHRHMHNGAVHKQSMSSASNGTPDFYYESNKEALWVEWKFWAVAPPTFNLAYPVMKSHKTKLSPLQRAWLERAEANGVNVRVICGYPKGGCVMSVTEALCTWSRQSFFDICVERKALAQWIEHFCYNEFFARNATAPCGVVGPTRRGR